MLIIVGIISLVLGVVGAFLPLLPTVPLVLLAAFCFARSSERLHIWLLSNRHFGTIVRNFEAGQGIPRRVKIRAITVVWISMGISCSIVAQVLLCTMLFLIGMGVSIYLWRLPEVTN
ncbi:MAG: YbaN family protein [Gammaproteobacteria bacterium]|nr:YbaN family protein [Gammaproteobacteria bacterium]